MGGFFSRISYLLSGTGITLAIVVVQEERKIFFLFSFFPLFFIFLFFLFLLFFFFAFGQFYYYFFLALFFSVEILARYYGSVWGEGEERRLQATIDNTATTGIVGRIVGVMQVCERGIGATAALKGRLLSGSVTLNRPVYWWVLIIKSHLEKQKKKKIKLAPYNVA